MANYVVKINPHDAKKNTYSSEGEEEEGSRNKPIMCI